MSAAETAEVSRSRPIEAAGGSGVRVLTPEEARGQREPWSALAGAAADDNLFFHPDFALPAIAAFGRGRVAIAAISGGGRLLAAAPFVSARLGHICPAVRLWSHDYGPLGTPLLAADRVAEAAAALVAALSPPRGSRCLIIPDLALDSVAAAALTRAAKESGRAVAVVARYERAVAGKRSETYRGAARLSAHRRHEYERQMRRLGELGQVTVETTAEPARIARQIGEFMALEAAGWKGQGGTALASQRARREFAVAAVQARAAAGAARIHTVRVDGRLVAGLVTMISGRTAYTWKIAYDEAFARFSPGVQVMLAATRHLLGEPGMETIDSCAGPNHSLVDPLLPDRTAMGTLVISPLRQGARYRAGLAVARLEASARQRAKALRQRFG